MLSCVLRWWAAQGRQLALSQVNSCISPTFDPGCCGHRRADGQKAGSVGTCSRAWVCVRIPLFHLRAMCLGPLASFPVRQFSHLQNRGTNRTYLLMLLDPRGWG